MKKQIIKDTAEYNYNLGYLKALDEVEKILHELELIKSLGVSEISIGFYNDDWDRFKQQLKELKEK